MLFNGGLLAFFIYCYVYILQNPPPPTILPHDMDGAQWAQGILALLIFFLILNIITIYRKTPAAERNLSSLTKINFKGIYKSKILLGMLIMLGYAYILPIVGFIVSTFIAIMLYMFLLGERRYVRLPAYSAVITSVFYVFFFWALDVWLPRGTGAFWGFSMMIESLFR